jgi:HD-GYP domain-containing protein (c-di-GMP phosphodiesterase class II)
LIHNFWTSPFFIASAVLTLGVGLYSFVISRILMEKAYRQSLLTLARAVETKDSGADGHGERVAEYVVAVAKSMRLPRNEIRNMEYAAFLQDIGNVRVPHAILNKTTRLSPEEFEILKNHTQVGAEMLSQVKFLKAIAPIVRHHHEAWDGTGYPDGLAGADIPLGSRILAVCTAYDAMTRTKSYRGRMKEEAVIGQLRSGIGIKYDPDVVETFLKIQRKVNFTGGP